jgi:hypothetical protein
VKVAVVQPYFFPYIGYIQLIKQADVFVVFDDVNFNTQGWVKRNRLLVNGHIHPFVLPLSKASQNKKINELSITYSQRNKSKLLKTIEQSYKKAAHFEQTMPVIEEVISYPDLNLVNFLTHNLTKLNQHLSLNTRFVLSSELNKQSDFDLVQNRIIETVKQLGGNEYLNLPGGVHLYSEEAFNAQDLKLTFIKPNLSPYPQLNTDQFIPALSIIDVMMNTDVNTLL